MAGGGVVVVRGDAGASYLQVFLNRFFKFNNTEACIF